MTSLQSQIKDRHTGRPMRHVGTIKETVTKHQAWMPSGRSGGERADFCGADLREVNLGVTEIGGAHLMLSMFVGADLRGANLSEISLHSATFHKADLSDACLSCAGLSEADFSMANLAGADLRGANLRGANLFKADLTGADLSGAQIGDANLLGANFTGANLNGTDLSRAPFKVGNIHQKVFEAALQGEIPDISSWYSSQAIARHYVGLVVAAAGDAGKSLAWCCGSDRACSLIYLASDPKIGKVPDFYADYSTAFTDLQRRAKEESGQHD